MDWWCTTIKQIDSIAIVWKIFKHSVVICNCLNVFGTSFEWRTHTGLSKVVYLMPGCTFECGKRKCSELGNNWEILIRTKFMSIIIWINAWLEALLGWQFPVALATASILLQQNVGDKPLSCNLSSQYAINSQRLWIKCYQYKEQRFSIVVATHVCVCACVCVYANPYAIADADRDADTYRYLYRYRYNCIYTYGYNYIDINKHRYRYACQWYAWYCSPSYIFSGNPQGI